jgi:TatD DNase family protein
LLTAPFIDFHTHSKRESDEVIEVISLHDSQQKSSRYYTIGFHPWWSENRLTSENLAFLNDKYLNDSQCLGIGECGMDNLKGAHLDIQEELFVQQIEVANALNAPMVIHCVRVFDRVIRLKKTIGKTPWVVHGFVRNKILATQLLDSDIYLSVAPSLHMSKPFEDTLKSLPLDRVFIETDSETSVNIAARYALFCSIGNHEMEEVKEQIFINFQQFYRNKWKHHFG